MTQASTLVEQVIDIFHQTDTCNLEEVKRLWTNLTWSQVFLAIGR